MKAADPVSSATSALAPLRDRWRALSLRDRRWATAGVCVLGAYALWALAMQPAWRTLERAPVEADRLDSQWLAMQRLAGESAELRAAPPVAPEQAAAALQAATARLGDRGRLVVQGDRAVLTLQNTGSGALRDWLAEARAGARARPIEARLARGPQGFSGTLVVAVGGRFLMTSPAARWAVGGAAVGAVFGLVAAAPAAWLAGVVADATAERVLLADARGTVWRGSAVLVLTGGAGSRDASALPGRVEWALSPDGAGLVLRARHACCINGELPLRVVPGFGRMRVELPPRTDAAQALGQWPAAWLVGLGTPWNTLQPTGALLLRSKGLAVEQVQGRWVFDGSAELDVDALASRVSTLDELGSYRLTLTGDARRGDPARVQLATRSGALQLSGSGTVLGAGAASTLRFQGQASASAGNEAVLANLLNIIGRRQGAVSVVSIG